MIPIAISIARDVNPLADAEQQADGHRSIQSRCQKRRRNKLTNAPQNHIRTAGERAIQRLIGRGSWIRTNDLQYPKLPRYQAALYPEYPLGNDVDTRLRRDQQAASGRFIGR